MRQAGNGTVSLFMVSRGQEQAQRHSYYLVLGKDLFKLSGFGAYLHVIPLPCPAYVGLKTVKES